MIANLMMKGFNLIESLRGQRGAVAWEYLLVVAVVSVGIVVGVAAGAPNMTNTVVTAVTTCLTTVITTQSLC